MNYINILYTIIEHEDDEILLKIDEMITKDLLEELEEYE